MNGTRIVPEKIRTERSSMKLKRVGKPKVVTVGKSDKFKPKHKSELARGVKVEHEHTNSPDVAKAIAKDHLKEMDNYYTELDKMEKNKKCATLVEEVLEKFAGRFNGRR